MTQGTVGAAISDSEFAAATHAQPRARAKAPFLRSVVVARPSLSVEES